MLYKLGGERVKLCPSYIYTFFVCFFCSIFLQEIVTDENAQKPEPKTASMDVIETSAANLTTICSSGVSLEGKFKMIPESFEKDDDENGHIDFITAASVRT